MGNWLKGALVGTRLEIAYLRCIMMKGSLLSGIDDSGFYFF